MALKDFELCVYFFQKGARRLWTQVLCPEVDRLLFLTFKTKWCIINIGVVLHWVFWSMLIFVFCETTCFTIMSYSECLVYFKEFLPPAFSDRTEFGVDETEDQYRRNLKWAMEACVDKCAFLAERAIGSEILVWNSWCLYVQFVVHLFWVIWPTDVRILRKSTIWA